MRNETEELLNTFPIGHLEFHPNANMNFQMNRWLNWGGDASMQAEMLDAAPRIETNADWIREFRALSERALAAGKKKKGASYARAAEFFMNADDPAKPGLRDMFIRTMREEAGIDEGDILKIAYPEGGPAATLAAMRFGEGGPKGALLVCGGFDSYFEELIAIARCFAAEGYDVVLFEGPGQGGVLESGIPMTHRWELPVAAILDAFGIGQAALIGISLGGYLALRAAAFEPRVRRVVAWDVIYDSLATMLSQLSPAARAAVRACLALRAGSLVDAVIRRRMRGSPVVDWGVKQGMRVFGQTRPYAFLRAASRCSAASFSKAIEADVLLLAGSEDHFVPLEMLRKQARALTGARSLATRVFTAQESAQAHCQVGNTGLALRVILDWLESTVAP